MRQIKFRGWRQGKMIDLANFTPLALDANLNTSGLFIPFLPDMILMQYTGLKDRQGVEIYEGDIISRTHSKDHKYDSKQGLRFGAVVFTMGMFIVEYTPHEFQESLTYFTDNVFDCGSEVIGNIHENPELLK